MASVGGGTPIHMTGMLFDQFKYHNGTTKPMDFKCRFRTPGGETIGEEQNMTMVSDIEYACIAPKSGFQGSTAIEI